MRNAPLHRFAVIALSITAVLLCPAASAVAGDFEALGPPGGHVNALAQSRANPDHVYAATRFGGVYLSRDAGATWELRSNGLPGGGVAGSYEGVRGLAADGAGRVYALGNAAAYYSDNQGGTWHPLPSPDGLRGGLVKLIVDPDDDDHLVASNGKLGRGIFVSRDRGLTWTLADEGLPSVRILDLEAGSAPDTYFAVAGDHLCVSTDGGDTWNDAGPLPAGEVWDLAVAHGTEAALYLAAGDHVRVSTDGGDTWTTPDGGMNAGVRHFVCGPSVLGFSRGAVFAITEDQLLRRDDPFPATRVYDAIVLQDGGVLVASQVGVFGAGPGIFDGTESLAMHSDGLVATDISAVVPVAGPSPVIYAACGVGQAGGVHRSDDGGTTWELRSQGITNLDIRSMAVAPSDPDVVYVGTVDTRDDDGENGGIFRTADGGLTWTDVTAGLPHAEPRIIIAMDVHPTDPDIVYASVQGYHGGIFKSTDGGATWERRSEGMESMPPMPGFEDNPFIDYFAMLSIDIDPQDPETVYVGAGGCWGAVYVTHDGGLTWLRRATGALEMDSNVPDPMMFPVHLELFAICVDPSDPARILTAGARGLFPAGNPQAGLVYESRDAGVSFDLVREVQKSDYFEDPVTGIAVEPNGSGRIVLATRGGVRLASDDSAAPTWQWLHGGLPEAARFTRTLATDPEGDGFLYVGTAFRGVWVRESEPVAVRLTAFRGTALADGRVELTWSVADAAGHLGFHVDREADGRRVRLTESLLAGRDSYRFVDAAPVAGTVNRYDLVEVDRTGRETILRSADIRTGAGPALAVGLVRPNPSRAGAVLEFTSGLRGPVRASVLDAAGRSVARLDPGVLDPGPHRVAWDGRDGTGRRAPPGLYFLRVEGNGITATRKVMLLP